MRTVADMPRVKATPKPCPIIEAHTGQPCGRDTEGLKNQCSQHGSRLSYRPDLDPGARPLGQAHPKGCPCDVHTKAPLPKCEPSCTCQRHTSTRLTCHIICQGIRCDRKIGRGHGDGQNYKGNQARQLCGGHDSRWRLNDGDTQDGLPLQPQHMGPDSERPRCAVEGCDCSPHRQRVDHHGHTDLLRHQNIGLTCSNPECETVCESGEDKFVMGMCAKCDTRLNGTGSLEKSVWHYKREGIHRTCSVEECDGDETGDTLLCKRHWNQDYQKRPGIQARSNATTARYRAKKQGANTDGHTIPELHEYWARGIDPKRCTYCDAWYRQWRNNWQTSIGDHVLAIHNGGSDTMENIVPCCITCNESKGARFLYVEWTPLNMRHELTAA
jgi:hypothetical protein